MRHLSQYQHPTSQPNNSTISSTRQRIFMLLMQLPAVRLRHNSHTIRHVTFPTQLWPHELTFTSLTLFDPSTLVCTLSLGYLSTYTPLRCPTLPFTRSEAIYHYSCMLLDVPRAGDPGAYGIQEWKLRTILRTVFGFFGIYEVRWDVV